jgi:cytochrome c-type biogenesis protein
MGDIMVGTNSISFILVFLEGLLSFLSPCVIPLIPIYMGYLAGGGKKVNEDGTIVFERKKVFFHTMFFVLGISFSFFILGMSFTALGSFFSSNKLLLTKAGGILIILLGLFQLGIFDFSFLQKERKININITDKKMNPMIALIMGFTFSFAWTPCIGPTLSSVLIMASGATTSVIGNMLVFVYAVGFLIPFLLLGLFTTQVLNFLKSRQKLLKYTIKVGGAILIIMGFMIFTGWMNGVSGYLNSISNNQQNTSQAIEDKSELTNNSDEIVSNNEMTSENQTTEDGNIASVEKDVISAFDFTLKDQYGNMHTLSDYKGKVVFLNFWATWCPPCNKELPDIEELYKEYNLNKDEVVFLGITNPSSEEYPNNQDVGKEEIISFLEDKKYTFPTLFDETGEVLQSYNISAFPTTFMIDKEGNIVGYVPGMMTKDIMVNVINQALNATD